MMPFPVRASVTRPIARPSIAKRPFNFSLKTLVWSTVLVLSAMVKTSSSSTVTFREALREALGESDHFGVLPSFLRRVLRHLFTEGSGVDWIIDRSRETPGVLSCWDSVRELLSNFLNGFFSCRLTFTQKKLMIAMVDFSSVRPWDWGACHRKRLPRRLGSLGGPCMRGTQSPWLIFLLFKG